jgi:hypothetical protein
MKFQKTYCSQCGGEFGAGDEGFSSCADHTKGNRMIDAMRAALKELEDVLECINQDKIPFDGDDFHETLRTLRQAIEQAEKEAALQEISDIGQWDTSDMAHRPSGLTVEQEPVAWVRDLTSPQPHCVTSMKYLSIADTDAGVKYIPVYAAPPKRPVKSYTGGEPQYATDAPQAEGEPWLGSPDHCSLHPDAPHGYNRKQSLKEHRYVCRCEGWRPDMSTKPENIDTKTGCVDSVDIEPVAWIYNGNLHAFDPTDWAAEPKNIQLLYLAPPKREWVGLTDTEIDYLEDAIDPAMYRVFARRIEAKLKEKNNG